jgi:hypothetical protein
MISRGLKEEMACVENEKENNKNLSGVKITWPKFETNTSGLFLLHQYVLF